MSATPSSTSSGSNMLRNIITGVITTVVGATAVYFLGFHNKGGDNASNNFPSQKEATLNGWNDYVSLENIFQKNFQVLRQNYTDESFSHYKEETLKESKKFNDDLSNISERKEIDPTLVSLLKRRLGFSEEMDKKYKYHLDKYENILNTTFDPAEKGNKIDDELRRYGKDVGDLNARYRNEIEEAVKTLSFKYGSQFSMNDLLMFQQAKTSTVNNNGNTNTGSAQMDWRMLIGTWEMTTDNRTIGTLYQYDDGRMYYYFYTGDSTYGRWQLNNNQLTLFYDYYYGAGYNYKYNLSDVTSNSFTMTYTNSPYNVVSAYRKF